MNDEERNWTKSKCNLILTMMKQKFEDEVYEYLEKSEFKSMDEMDAWIDERLHRFYDERESVKKYYEAKIYS